ncbi:MAG TPA: DmsE family decaheme c-type cytochrome [Gemmatimonadaceae bacterium]|nr:DmsE family decaheme c-type cytochrome [Gemmatimonadaceae bacterium]
MRQLPLLFLAAVLGTAPAMARAQVPAPAAQAANKPPPGYAGSASCVDCHRAASAEFAETNKGRLFLAHPRDGHEKLGCESCHGPAMQHVESGGEERGGLITFGRKAPSPVAVRNATCLGCHQKTARTLWQGSVHESRNVACSDCHEMMHAESERGGLKRQSVVETCGGCHAEKKAKLSRFSHMPLGEGKMECTSCHNPHGSANEKMLVGNSVSATCASCHAEKRGPFLWEHMPVVESCANCHDSHGSNKERMLRISRPRLCQQCHPTAHGSPTAKPSDPAAVRFVYNRQCSNCHFNIHGSNHPAGAFFTR